MCPRYILSDNGTEFKNNLMDQVLQQLGIDRIFSAPYHPQSNGKLEVFHKYLKPTLKKLCENDPANWDKYINQVLASYRITPNLATAESTFFLVYGRDPNLPLHQLLEPMQHFLGDPDSGKLHLETHRLALATWNATGSSSRDNSLELNNSSDPWNNTHQHQHNSSLHFIWNCPTYRTYINPVKPLSHPPST